MRITAALQSGEDNAQGGSYECVSMSDGREGRRLSQTLLSSAQ